jgi:hypothetical protein
MHMTVGVGPASTGALQTPSPLQVCPPVHLAQAPPPAPQCAVVSPASQVAPEQHPEHDDGLHAHTPLSHSCPAAQVPVVHIPPQPSLPPQAALVQSGAQVHTPSSHTSGAVHTSPAQHCAPSAPQVVHSSPSHVVPEEQAVQAPPPSPHAVSSVPGSHVSPEQQPLHDVGSQVQTPPLQSCPTAHAPEAHTPPQPSLPPQSAPAQLGVQEPVPHVLGAPPPPHVSPAAQLPQATTVPHRVVTWPHLPVQNEASTSHPGFPIPASPAVWPASTPVWPASTPPSEQMQGR